MIIMNDDDDSDDIDDDDDDGDDSDEKQSSLTYAFNDQFGYFFILPWRNSRNNLI